jgi:hypothetical protein
MMTQFPTLIGMIRGLLGKDRIRAGAATLAHVDGLARRLIGKAETLVSKLFTDWLEPVASTATDVPLYMERKNSRSAGMQALGKLLVEHFVGEDTVLRMGGYTEAAKTILNSISTTKRTVGGPGGANRHRVRRRRDILPRPHPQAPVEERSQNADARQRRHRPREEGREGSRLEGRVEERRVLGFSELGVDHARPGARRWRRPAGAPAKRGVGG